jgi:predicted amidophosphoribosyltransferase
MDRDDPQMLKKFCRVCGEPAPDIICERCATLVQGEAARQKWQGERGVRTDANRK